MKFIGGFIALFVGLSFDYNVTIGQVLWFIFGVGLFCLGLWVDIIKSTKRNVQVDRKAR